MTEERYKEYQRILYDCGKLDLDDVVNDSFSAAKKQRLLMRKKLLEFEEKYGAVHDHLVKSGRDYAQFCMIVNG